MELFGALNKTHTIPDGEQIPTNFMTEPDPAQNGPNGSDLYAALITHIAGCTLELIQNAGMTLAPEERDQALHILSYALNVEMAWPIARDLLLVLAPKMELMGHRYDWTPFLNRGIEAAQRFGEISIAAEYRLQLGTLYRLLSRFEEAREVVQASIENFIAVENKDGEARGLNELAWTEHLAHNYDLADTYARHALQILDEDAPERGTSYRVLGMVAYYQGNSIDAEKWHRQALAIFETQGDQRKTAWALQNIALSLRRQERFEDAILYSSHAATLLEKVNDQSRWSMTQIGLGLAYYNVENFSLARECYLRAYPVAQRLNDKLQLAMIQGNLALVYSAQLDYDQAIEYFTNAIALYTQVGDTVWTLYNMEGLASCYIKQKKYSEARALLETIKQKLPEISASPYAKDLSQLIESHLEMLHNMEVAI